MHPSFATRPNLDLLEQNYERWQKDPDSLDSGWSAFFEGFELGSLDGKNGAAVEAPPEARRDLRESPLQTRIDALVYAYRILGHTIAWVNPLAEKRPENPLLTLREFGFSDKDLDYPVSSKFFLDNRQMSLREMIALLDQIYAGSIAASPRIAHFRSSSFAGNTSRAPSRATRSGNLRSLSAPELRRAKTFFAARRGRFDGDSRHPFAQVC